FRRQRFRAESRCAAPAVSIELAYTTSSRIAWHRPLPQASRCTQCRMGCDVDWYFVDFRWIDDCGQELPGSPETTRQPYCVQQREAYMLMRLLRTKIAHDDATCEYSGNLRAVVPCCGNRLAFEHVRVRRSAPRVVIFPPLVATRRNQRTSGRP